MNQTTQGWWMVVGAGQPVYKHPTLMSAMTEAERLAGLHPYQDFTVVKSVCTFRRQTIVRIDHVDKQPDGTEVPF